MKTFSRLGRFVTLCVLASVAIMLLGTFLSSWLLGIEHQQKMMSAIVLMIDRQLDIYPQQSDFARSIMGIVESEDISHLSITQDDTIYFSYTKPSEAISPSHSHLFEFALQNHPRYYISIRAQWPLQVFRYSPVVLTGIAISLLLVLLGLWFSLFRLKSAFHGAELLLRRAESISRGDIFKARHGDEWPWVVSESLDLLQSKLEEANKDRSRFDSFMRSNAFVDPRSGLGNRIFFDNRLEAVLSEPASLSGALLLIEMASYDTILSYQGKDMAEQYFNDSCALVGQFVRKYSDAVVARYDEQVIALLVPHISELGVDALGMKLYKGLSQLSLPAYIHRDFSFYIGIVCFEHGESLSQLNDEAQMALRGAAVQESGGWYLYEKGLHQNITEKGSVRWRTLFSRILAQRDVMLFLQSVCDGEGQVVQQELFGRIRDEDGRILSAGVFMPMAERVGMHVDFDRMMVQRMLLLIKREKIACASIRISINLHVDSLLQRNFNRWLRIELLQLTKQQLGMIVFEISEHQISPHFMALKRPLSALRKIGCRLCVDHAGQDVVSTQYIKEYAIDFLKLHTSLVRNIDQRQVNQMAVRSLVGGATGSARVMAVGVETKAEWRVLSYLGVSAGQGFFFARPVLYQGDD